MSTICLMIASIVTYMPVRDLPETSVSYWMTPFSTISIGKPPVTSAMGTMAAHSRCRLYRYTTLC